jgi:hypothetical protein
MRAAAVAGFVTVALLVYAGLNLYIAWRFRQGLAGWPTVRNVLPAALLAWALVFPTGQILHHAAGVDLPPFAAWAGALYLGLMVHALFLALAVDLARAGNEVFRWFPAAVARDPRLWARLTLLVAAGLCAAALSLGLLNARRLVVRRVAVDVAKAAGPGREWTLAAVSDLHLGAVRGEAFFDRVVDRINALDPDVVLLVGDTFDEDPGHIGRTFVPGVARLRPRHGVYAVTGNHEYYSGLDKARALYREAGVVLLEDSSAVVAGALVLAGRKDRTAERAPGGRKSVRSLLEGADRSLPVVLLDHQPFHLERVQAAGVDLQVSGHTHHGQMIPFHWITKKVYELSWGTLKKGGTWFVVSCGAGTWGPPVRTGSVSEILDIRLRLTGAAASDAPAG